MTEKTLYTYKIKGDCNAYYYKEEGLFLHLNNSYMLEVVCSFHLEEYTYSDVVLNPYLWLPDLIFLMCSELASLDKNWSVLLFVF